MAFELTSDVFKSGDTIPTRYTCDGKNISPPLTWRGIPEKTRSQVLVCEDPDAPQGTFTHWMLYNIPADVDHLPEDFGSGEKVNWRSVQGRNDFGKNSYGGPCPPPGPPHRYYFLLYALDEQLDLPSGVTRSQLLNQIEAHVVGRAELMGRYGRNQ